jgi:hypothetical protein
MGLRIILTSLPLQWVFWEAPLGVYWDFYGNCGLKKLLMGNEAIALGALRAGVQVAAGYPGTPSTEILETLV